MSDASKNQPTGPEPSPPPGGDDEPVPKLPRGRGIKLSLAEILRIAMIGVMLVAVLALRQPCSENMGRFIESFEPPPDAGLATPPRGLPQGEYIRLTGDMTEDELREKLERLEERDAGAGEGGQEPEADDGASPGDSVEAAPRP